MNNIYCEKCNGEDLASICKWCHLDGIKKAKRQGALDALNSVEFRQSLLQAKVTELKFMFKRTKKKYGICIFTKDLEKRMEELEKELK